MLLKVKRNTFIHVIFNELTDSLMFKFIKNDTLKTWQSSFPMQRGAMTRKHRSSSGSSVRPEVHPGVLRPKLQARTPVTSPSVRSSPQISREPLGHAGAQAPGPNHGLRPCILRRRRKVSQDTPVWSGQGACEGVHHLQRSSGTESCWTYTCLRVLLPCGDIPSPTRGCESKNNPDAKPQRQVWGAWSPSWRRLWGGDVGPSSHWGCIMSP